MVETIIRLNPEADKTAVTIHRRAAGQLSGSSGALSILGSVSAIATAVLDLVIRSAVGSEDMV